ncbi:MAG: hypothetical protein MUE99_09495 [Chitinophagaceae bacterium]|nr:hypothetical protein [Chitinophagaceae bacterium]
MKNKILPILSGFILIVHAGCYSGNNREEPDGGPCSYDEYRIPARIISLEALDSNSFDVTMKLDSNEYVVPPYDTLNIYMELSRFLTKAEVDSLGLKKGKALTYQMLRINSGSCNPEINTLLLETME